MIPTRAALRHHPNTLDWDPPLAARPTFEQVLDQTAFFILCAFAVSISWSETLPRVGDFVLVRWLGLLAGVVGLLKVLAGGRIRRFSPVHLAMAAFVAWSACTLFWTVDWDSSLTRLGTYSQLLFSVWLMWELAPTEYRVDWLLRAYSLGTSFAAANTIYNFALGRTAAQLTPEGGDHQLYSGTRFTTEGLNANDLGLMLALSIPILLYLMVRSRHALASSLYWVQLAASVTALLLTASRGALLSALAGFLMFPFAWRRLSLGERTFSLAAIAATGIGALVIVPTQVWNRLATTVTALWSSLNEGGTLTHRVDLWRAGWETFKEHSLLGIGTGGYGQAILRMVDIPYVAHNTFLSVLVELGVIGALILAGLMAMLAWRAYKMPKLPAALWLTILLTWSVGVSALTWEYRKPTWFLFGLLVAHGAAKCSPPAWGQRFR